jgi:hypothetical protein
MQTLTVSLVGITPHEDEEEHEDFLYGVTLDVAGYAIASVGGWSHSLMPNGWSSFDVWVNVPDGFEWSEGPNWWATRGQLWELLFQKYGIMATEFILETIEDAVLV